MNTKTYEKPQMKLISLKADKTVANTCWGHHASGQVLYADIPGLGYCSFQIQNGHCTLNLTNVKYITKEGTTDATADQIKALDSVLRSSGGESGNPYAGEGTVVKIDPDPTWS